MIGIILIIILISIIMGGSYYYYAYIYKQNQPTILPGEVGTDQIQPNKINGQVAVQVAAKTGQVAGKGGQVAGQVGQVADKGGQAADQVAGQTGTTLTIGQTGTTLTGQTPIISTGLKPIPKGQNPDPFKFDHDKVGTIQDTVLTTVGQVALDNLVETAVQFIDHPEAAKAMLKGVEKGLQQFMRFGSKPISSTIDALAETKALMGSLTRNVIADGGNAMKAVYSTGLGVTRSIANTVSRIGKILNNMKGSIKLPSNLLRAARAAGYAVQSATEAIEAAKAAKLAVEVAKDVKIAVEITKDAKLAIQVAEDAKIAAQVARIAVEVGQAAVAAAKAAQVMMMANPAGVILMAFQIINMAVDAADPAGYNLLDKWKEINEQVKLLVEGIITDLQEKNDGAPVKYPTTIGPLDILSFVPVPSSSLEPSEMGSTEPGENVNENVDEEGPTMLKYLVKQEIKSIILNKDDPDIKPLYQLFENLARTNPDATDSDYSDLVSQFIDDNSDLIIKNKALPKICIEYGGIMTKDEEPICMFTKENCVNHEPPPPPPNCKKVPDPNQDKCGPPNAPVNYVCDPNEMSKVADYDIMKGWSDKSQKCLTVNATVKAMCDSNGMPYDLDKDICIITEEMCRSKTGKPKKLADGTIDCQMPIGQMIVEGVFGKTLTDTLIQTFDPEQYEDCKEGYIDVGKDGAMGKLNDICKGKSGGTAADATVATTTVAMAAAGPGLVVAGAGLAVACSVASISSYFCRKKCGPGETDVMGVCWIDQPKVSDPPCDPGYNFDGVTTCNAKNVTAKLSFPSPNKCPDGYDLQGTGPSCIKKKCHDGDKDNGLVCQESCRDGYKENGAGLCISDKKPILVPLLREPCDKGYKYDGLTTCWMDPVITSRGIGIGADMCPNEYTNIPSSITGSGICWENCNGPNVVDKGATCETCDPGLKNNGATLCYEACDSGYTYDGTKMCNFNPVTVGAGVIPDQCPDGYNNFGGVCYNKQCPAGYRYDGQISCVRDDKKLATGTPIITNCPGGWTNTGLLCTEPLKTDPCGKRSVRTCSNIGNACNCSYKLARTCSNIGKACGCHHRTARNCVNVYGRESCVGGDCIAGVGGDCGNYESCVGGDCMPGVGGDCGTHEVCVGGDCLPVTTGGSTKPADISCPANKNKAGALCFDQCPDGYKYNDAGAPVSCVPNSDRGPIFTQSDTKKPLCSNNRDTVDGLCYNKCNNGTSRVAGAPTQCQGPRGLIYPTKTQVPKVVGKKSEPAKCKSNREMRDLLCYIKCDDKFGECYRANPNAATECMPKRGISYQPNIVGCPDGYSDNGASMCSTSYVPKPYGKRIITADCTGNREQIDGSCYDYCPIIDGPDGKKIQLKHLDKFPLQCVPPRGVTYPGLVLSYVPDTYAKGRRVAYSKK